MRIKMRLFRSDMRDLFRGRLPFDFQDANGAVIGKIVSVDYDGNYTTGEAEIIPGFEDRVHPDHKRLKL